MLSEDETRTEKNEEDILYPEEVKERYWTRALERSRSSRGPLSKSQLDGARERSERDQSRSTKRRLRIQHGGKENEDATKK